MRTRGLAADDVFLAPENEDQLAALVRIVNADFDYLKTLTEKTSSK
jgi:hypothetical protein